MIKNVSNVLISFFVLALVGLTGCGGGGGGGGTSDNQTPVGTSVNLASFRGVFLGTSTGAQYSFPVLFGSDSQNRVWSGSFTVIADGPTTFEGQNVSKSRSLITLQLAGGTPVSGTSTVYFQISDSNPYKSFDSFGVTYTPTSLGTIPTTAKVGDFGTLASVSGSDGTTETSTWALNAGSNGASILVISSIVKTGATVTFTESNSFTLDSAGTTTKLDIILTTGGITVTLSGNKI